MKLTTGFTLVEILVVTSIISLLSSLLISSTQAARDRAYNTKVIYQISEYAKALALYQSDHGGFPSVASTADWQCLGQGNTGGTCGAGSLYLEDGVLKTKLQPYLPGLPVVGDNVAITYDPGLSFRGGLYHACHDDGGTLCSSLQLRFVLKGSNASCPRPANTTNSEVINSTNPSFTQCTLTLQ